MSAIKDKIEGKARAAIGRATNNREEWIKGKIQETKGKAESKIKRAM
jgi:uncharacterized protein YjbJ (UPF0337 family)